MISSLNNITHTHTHRHDEIKSENSEHTKYMTHGRSTHTLRTFRVYEVDVSRHS